MKPEIKDRELLTKEQYYDMIEDYYYNMQQNESALYEQKEVLV